MGRPWFALVLLLVAPDVFAAGAEPAQAEAARRTRAGLRGWYVFPGVFYTPETRFGVAVVLGTHFGVAEGLATSSAELILYGTQNGQAAARLVSSTYLSRTLLLDAEAEGSYFPSPYYGVGNDAPASAEEQYTNRYLDLEIATLWTVAGRLRLGPQLHLRREVAVEREPGGALAAGGVTGSGDWGAAGGGLAVSWDGRDDRFQPSAGGYLAAGWSYYPEATVAGAGAFGRGELDARWFLAPLPGHALGAQLRLEGGHGDVPVTVLPNIGGNDTLRGYVDGRYRDRIGYSGQVEWRYPIAGRFRGTVFAGAGGVAHDLPDLGSRWPRAAAGVGLRFRLTTTGAYLRADAAYGEEGMQIYFLTMEAF